MKSIRPRNFVVRANERFIMHAFVSIGTAGLLCTWRLYRNRERDDGPREEGPK